MTPLPTNIPPGHRIISAASNGAGGTRLTTAGSHLLAGTETIVVTVTVAGYTGTYIGSSDQFLVIDATHFDLAGIAFTATTVGHWH